MTSPADTLTVQQLDELEGLLAAQSVGGDYVAAMRFVTEAPTAMRALLATVRRQQAALDAVTELADSLDRMGIAELEEAKANPVQPDLLKKSKRRFVYSAAIRTALASPAPTEAAT